MPLTLDTARLHLRELVVEDAAALLVWEADPDVVRWQSNDARTLEDCRAYIEEGMVEAAADPRRFFEVGCTRRDMGLLVGRVGLRVKRPEHREAEIWFAFRRDQQGQGFATEAMRAVVDHGFRELGLHRVYGDCDPRNLPSSRLMERLGMRREGHLRENWWLKGEWCDSWIYSVLDREWSVT